jgi:uncharacterized protein YjiS (DUF1127 family)
MTTAISSWRRDLSYRAMVRELKALSPRELGALGIRPADIDHLAFEASRIPTARGPLPDYWTPIRFMSLIVVLAAPITAGLRLWLGYAP